VSQPLDTSALASTVATPAQGLERPNGAQSGEILGHYQPNTALGKFEQEGHLGADFQPLRAVKPDFEAARRPVETFAPAHTAAEGLQSNLGLVGARSGQDFAHSGGLQGFPSEENQLSQGEICGNLGDPGTARSVFDAAAQQYTAAAAVHNASGSVGARSGPNSVHFGGVQGSHQVPEYAQFSPESANVEHFENGKAAARPTHGQWRPQEGPSGACRPRSGIKLEDSQAEVVKSEFLGSFEPSFTHTLQAPPYPFLTHTHTQHQSFHNSSRQPHGGGGVEPGPSGPPISNKFEEENFLPQFSTNTTGHLDTHFLSSESGLSPPHTAYVPVLLCNTTEGNIAGVGGENSFLEIPSQQAPSFLGGGGIASVPEGGGYTDARGQDQDSKCIC